MTGTTSAFGLEFDSLRRGVIRWRRHAVLRVGLRRWTVGMGGGVSVRGGGGRPACAVTPVGQPDKRYFVGMPSPPARESPRPRLRFSVGFSGPWEGGCGTDDRDRAALLMVTPSGSHFKTLDLQTRRSSPVLFCWRCSWPRWRRSRRSVCWCSPTGTCRLLHRLAWSRGAPCGRPPVLSFGGDESGGACTSRQASIGADVVKLVRLSMELVVRPN